MAKYDVLREHLRQRPRRPVVMSFEEIDGLLTGGLPRSAYLYGAWWSNEINGRHFQARGWLDAGYWVVAVDLGTRTVTFGARSR